MLLKQRSQEPYRQLAFRRYTIRLPEASKYVSGLRDRDASGFKSLTCLNSRRAAATNS
jgi:hypothetical protein